MNVIYYPGCTLKNTARNFEDSALFALEKLGVQVDELPRWYCCGTVFALSTDTLIHHVAPIRNLIRVKEAGADSVVTLCAMCFNTLKRANERVKNDSESLDIINRFMSDEELEYDGDVRVLHLLELLRDDIQFDSLKKHTKKRLKNLNVASYYGCMLVRPEGVGFDDPEDPALLEQLTEQLGAKAVEFPYRTECCGAYQTVNNPDLVSERTERIITSARENGADLITVSCPLCAFNLDHRQQLTRQRYPGFKSLPVLYFTQLMALAMGAEPDRLGLDPPHVDPRPLLIDRIPR